VVGLAAKGITVQTRPNAPVVAAHDGKVIYAGPFRGYGRIIIIEHGQGFLTLLAGLGRVDVQTGQGLLAGEPVGTMKNAETIGDVKSRHLYIELRQDGAPVDPLAWLSTQRDTAIQ
jgi:septal ring factor EnvC (AmiA/AmiB activator)